MYQEYFGLSERPFNISPDPRYLFMSRRHQEALAHLVYGLNEGGGFVQLTGEVGTGKTTLTRALLEQIPDKVEVALIFNPRLTSLEFLRAICDELQISYPEDTSSVKDLIDILNAYLLEIHSSGRHVVLIVDEAQNFHPEVLEQIRLLTNLETTKQKLLQIILVGQPELRELLARPELRQLAQRITARYHLAPLNRQETREYISHRLKVAGAKHPVFTMAAVRAVHRFSQGVPRLINIICDRSLLGAYSTDSQVVDAKHVRNAAREIGAELFGQAHVVPSRFPLYVWGGGAAFAVVALVGAGLYVSGMWPAMWPGEHTPEQTGPTATAVAPAAAQSPASVKRPIELAGFEVAALLGPLTVERRQQALAGHRVPLETVLRQPAAHQIDQAFVELFRVWGIDYGAAGGSSVCDKAVSVRLRCLWSSGSWDEFVKLNRPGLIEILGHDGRRSYLVIAAAADERVLLAVGERYFAVARAELARVWPGEYLLLWRPPALDVKLIRPGDTGRLVVWLRNNLDRVLGPLASPAERPEVFDAALLNRVKQFQRRRFLQPDGLVGEKTIIHLNSASGDPTIPRLMANAALYSQ